MNCAVIPNIPIEACQKTQEGTCETFQNDDTKTKMHCGDRELKTVKQVMVAALDGHVLMEVGCTTYGIGPLGCNFDLVGRDCRWFKVRLLEAWPIDARVRCGTSLNEHVGSLLAECGGWAI